jgi:cysteine dioxygenase
MNLKETIDILENYGEPIPYSVLKDTLKNTDVSLEDVGHCVRFDPNDYTRNILHTGSHFEVFIICWKDGQCSQIHDHAGSCCGVKILEGVATENMFLQKDSSVFPCITMTYNKGDTLVNEDLEIHQIANLQGNGKDLISLHVYSPPLKNTNYYN